MPDSGIGGETQMSSICDASCGFSRRMKTVLTELEVATSTTPVATAKALAWWLAERTVLKHWFGTMPRGLNRKVRGARVPEVDWASPMPKSYCLPQARTLSSVMPEPLRTIRVEV